ncbi:hypothetical protein C2W62_36905 [Candidatus Entotheonella serta]|nr:hypothetical protein C2W62_36905 [Candidatus Entotheonella serta]
MQIDALFQTLNLNPEQVVTRCKILFFHLVQTQQINLPDIVAQLGNADGLSQLLHHNFEAIFSDLEDLLIGQGRFHFLNALRAVLA